MLGAQKYLTQTLSFLAHDLYASYHTYVRGDHANSPITGASNPQGEGHFIGRPINL